MPAEPPLSLADWAVLALVVEQPRHGFALARELAPDAAIGQIWTVRRPLVYRAIEHLTALGLLAATRTEPGDQGPRRTVLRATRRGRALAARWLSRPVTHLRDARTELLLKLVLLERSDGDSSELARRQLEVFGPLANALAERAGVASGPDRAVARYRAETSRAVVRMLESLTELRS